MNEEQKKSFVPPDLLVITQLYLLTLRTEAFRCCLVPEKSLFRLWQDAQCSLSVGDGQLSARNNERGRGVGVGVWCSQFFLQMTVL